MGWSTTVVVPPDGDMADYMRSLDRLRQRDDTVYFPAHGPPVTKPGQYVRHLVGHRLQREKQILGLVRAAPSTIPQIVAAAYPGLDPRLIAAAGGLSNESDRANVESAISDLKRALGGDDKDVIDTKANALAQASAAIAQQVPCGAPSPSSRPALEEKFW